MKQRIENTMPFDEGTYMVLKSATGAYFCRQPILPKEWDNIHRPHVAMLLPSDDSVFRIYLSEPEKLSHKAPLKIYPIESVPLGTILEIRYSETEYSYYRKDLVGWTKVGEAADPFYIEVLTSELMSLSFNTSEPTDDNAHVTSEK